jgi:energy-coupling factor transporter ATP-binding protein EcfA2
MLRSGTGIFVAVIGLFGLPAVTAPWWWPLLRSRPSLIPLALAAFVVGVAAVFVGDVAAELRSLRSRRTAEHIDALLTGVFGRFGSRYRKYLAGTLRYVDLKGLAIVGAHSPTLEDVFVDVSLAPRPPHDVPADVLGDVPQDITHRYSLLELLDERQPTVLAITGPPGSGKTTLLRHVALHLSGTARRARREVAVFIALRDHAQRIADDPAVTLPSVWCSSLGPLNSPAASGWLERRLRRGRCVILLDGLDEVATTVRRQQVASWIEDQISIHPRNDYVVTARPHGYRSAGIAGATVMQTRPFTRDQTARFIHAWYRATERHATGEEGPAVDSLARSSAEDLLERLQATPALHDFAANPLLLTMIVNVHRYRGQLPGSRADLYSEMCQVMLWRRQAAKRLPLDGVAGPTRQRLLAELAYVLMTERVRDVSAARATEILQPALDRIVADCGCEDLLHDTAAGGFLIEREAGRYSFAHLTFQEYLAARHIHERGLLDVLTRNVSDDWWRETTLLYAGGNKIDQIIEACLTENTVPALALAFDCLDVEPEISVQLRDRLAGLLRDAFGPDSPSGRRELVASVLTAGTGRSTIVSRSGARVCLRPVPGAAYALFVDETGTPAPDGAALPDPGSTDPATGIWEQDAVAFVRWINSLPANLGGRRYEIPDIADVADPVVAESIKTLHDRSGHLAWVTSRGSNGQLVLVRSTAPAARELDVAALAQALTNDICSHPLVGLHLLLLRVSGAAEHLQRLIASYEQTVGRLATLLSDASVLRDERRDIESSSDQLRQSTGQLRAMIAQSIDVAQHVPAPHGTASHLALAAAVADRIADGASRTRQYLNDDVDGSLALMASLIDDIHADPQDLRGLRSSLGHAAQTARTRITTLTGRLRSLHSQVRLEPLAAAIDLVNQRSPWRHFLSDIPRLPTALHRHLPTNDSSRAPADTVAPRLASLLTAAVIRQINPGTGRFTDVPLEQLPDLCQEACAALLSDLGPDLATVTTHITAAITEITTRGSAQPNPATVSAARAATALLLISLPEHRLDTRQIRSLERDLAQLAAGITLLDLRRRHLQPTPETIILAIS